MARLNVSLDAEHVDLLDSIRKENESRSEALRQALHSLAKQRGFSVEYVPAKMTIRRGDQ